MESSQGAAVVVLAGGSGRRLATLTGGVPKQFYDFGRGRSLLAETLRRVGPVASPRRTTVVAARTHECYLASADLAGAQVLRQPCDRGTAAGVLFGLLPFIGAGGDPVVLLTPSDHGVRNDDEFLRSVRDTITDVESGANGVVLFGARPSGPDGDYGWISPGVATGVGGHGLRPVASFVEKPPPEVAARLFDDGAVWNTMVVVARLSVLLEFYRRHLPSVTSALMQASRSSSAGHREDAIEACYRSVAPADFCRDVLTRAAPLAVRIWPSTLGWSDLGTPERLGRWMAGAGQGERDEESHGGVAAAHAPAAMYLEDIS